MKNFNDELKNLMAMAEADIQDQSLEKPEFTVDEGFYDRVRMPKRFRGVTFNTHPNEATERVKKFCTKKGGGVLMLVGPVGTGKTETACCSFYERAKLGLNAGEYLNVKRELCPMYRSSRLTTSTITEWQFFEHLYNLPFLILDEVGQGDNQDIERLVVTNILSACYDNDTKVIITSNMTTRQFCEFMGDRIHDRLRQVAEEVILNGKSWRVE
ncbi:MAG: ATP-binding protein [Treponema sp.]|nr:ATP-binding protein [Treponema sp.]